MQRNYAGYPVEVEEFNPSGETLFVLLHGFGASTFSWRSVADQLAELGQVIAYDRPGFGFTPLTSLDHEVDPYSLAGQVELLRQVITSEAKGRKVVVIGHSAGGLIATEFALRYPNLLNALILESPAIWREPPRLAALGRALRLPTVERYVTKLISRGTNVGIKILEQAYFDKAKLTDSVYAGYCAPLNREDWPIALWRFMTADHSNQVRKNLWRLELPVFVITGDQDQIVKVEDTFKVAERIVGHSINLVSNTGHIAHEERPEDFMRVVRGFLAKHLG